MKAWPKDSKRAGDLIPSREKEGSEALWKREAMCPYRRTKF